MYLVEALSQLLMIHCLVASALALFSVVCTAVHV